MTDARDKRAPAKLRISKSAAVPGIPTGFSIWETLSSRTPGLRASEAQLTMMPAIASQTTGRQRREGRLPSGKNKGTRVTAAPTQTQNSQVVSQAAIGPRERSSGVSLDLRYPSAMRETTAESAITRNSQPTGLRGWRAATNAPTNA
jgi:hypothetical protein